MLCSLHSPHCVAGICGVLSGCDEGDGGRGAQRRFGPDLPPVVHHSRCGAGHLRVVPHHSLAGNVLRTHSPTRGQPAKGHLLPRHRQVQGARRGVLQPRLHAAPCMAAGSRPATRDGAQHDGLRGLRVPAGSGGLQSALSLGGVRELALLQKGAAERSDGQADSRRAASDPLPHSSAPHRLRPRRLPERDAVPPAVAGPVPLSP
mmetsp:Transcript_23764/g.32532  ORF Transcript_23764/g.32532 Transcript_23764/m.32532 type:complete len:204 (-) Transcript_23764:3185-3796(-)